MRLTTQQVEHFDRDGYLFFPSLFTPDEIRTLTDEVPRLFAQHRPENVREKGRDAVRTNFAAHLYSPPFARLARHPRMVEPVMQIFGEAVYMHQFKINGKMAFDGDLWQWHQDYGTWQRDDDMPEPRAMNVAIFLDEVNEFNAPLMFIPGSHTLGVIGAAHDLATTSYPLWTIDNDTIGRARRHRRPEGPARIDDRVPLLPRACVDGESLAVEPGERVPEPVRGLQSHPPLQAAGIHRPPRLHAVAVSARRLPAQGLRGAAALARRHADSGTGKYLRGVIMSAAGPSQGANCAPAFGGSVAAEWVNEAASVGVV